MGEVWRATDTRLGREVAIKLLPAAFAQDAERVARFRREAQVLATLNDPHIAAIHGLEEMDGGIALALELAHGEDLAARLKRGLLPVEEAIPIARQIAAGLESAHEKGIVHRDLKPANVMLGADGGVKILDFGLAKGFGDERAGDSNLSNSPTLTHDATRAGTILGTAAYMSPEQARGKAVDKRADVWAFGVVLYEMLSGRRLFAGETVSDTLAAVLRQDVDMSALPAETPARVRRLVARCLERDPKRRLRDIGEARLVLEDPGAAEAPAARSRPSRLPWIVAVAALVVATLAVAVIVLDTPPVRRLRLTLEPPPGVSFDACQGDFMVISPDGEKIVFTGRTPEGRRQLYLRGLDSLDARPLPDSDDAFEPFWSPDSRTVAFGAQGKLRRVEIAGGRAKTLADAPRLVGGSWGRDGTILFAPDFNSPLSRVSADGGTAVAATTLQAPDTAHRGPHFLPDGKHFLFVAGPAGAPHVDVGGLDDPGTRKLVPGATAAWYSPPGWLLFSRDGALWAQPFDAAQRELSDQPIMISTESGTASSFDVPGAASHFSASEDGILVWRRNFKPDYQLVWYDRQGRRVGAVEPVTHVALTMAPRLSPDDRRVVLQNRDPEAEHLGIWVIDLERGVSTRLSNVLGQFPQWSPDGSRVAWLQNHNDVVGIQQKASNGAGEPELVLAAGPAAGGNTFPADWSRDGRFLLYTTRGAKTRLDTWMLPLSGDRKPYPLLARDYDEHGAQLSPDGRLVAYRADESGRYEVYLQSVTADGRLGDEKWRVSAAGGTQPRFRDDGRELFFLSADGHLMAVPLGTAAGVMTVGTPAALFAPHVLPPGAGAAYEYDASADGQRFLVGTVLEGPGARPPTPVIVLDWRQGLEDAKR